MKKDQLQSLLGWIAAICLFLLILAAPDNPTKQDISFNKLLYGLFLLCLFILTPASMIFTWNKFPFTGLTAALTIWTAYQNFLSGSLISDNYLIVPAVIGWPIIYTIDFFVFWWPARRKKYPKKVL